MRFAMMSVLALLVIVAGIWAESRGVNEFLVCAAAGLLIVLADHRVRGVR